MKWRRAAVVGGHRWRSGAVHHWWGGVDVSHWWRSGALNDGERQRRNGAVTGGGPRWIRSAVGSDDTLRRHGGRRASPAAYW